MEYIPIDVLNETLKPELLEKNLFAQILLKEYPKEKVVSVFEKYKIGTARSGSATFPYIDSKGNVTDIRVIDFDENGSEVLNHSLVEVIRTNHELKKRPIPEWILKYEFQKPTQCWFGEQLLKDADREIRVYDDAVAVIFYEVVNNDYIRISGEGSLKSIEVKVKKQAVGDFRASVSTIKEIDFCEMSQSEAKPIPFNIAPKWSKQRDESIKSENKNKSDWPYKPGDKIQVSVDNSVWTTRIYMGYLKQAIYPWKVVDEKEEESFRKGLPVNYNSFPYAKPAPSMPELTKEEAEKKYGIRIVDSSVSLFQEEYNKLNSVMRKIYDLLPSNFTTAQALKIAIQYKQGERTFKSHLKNSILFETVKHGHYQKRNPQTYEFIRLPKVSYPYKF